MFSFIKKVFSKFYSFGLSDSETFLNRQRAIRNIEWNEIEGFIPNGSKFLDIGCGKGHGLSLAARKGCQVVGVDPFPDNAGVSPELQDLGCEYRIVEGFCENLPFEDSSFDVVYSSHMLEHTSDYEKSISEMSRVLQPDGVLIMGVPTATMAFVRLLSILIFSTHRNIIEILRYPLKSAEWKRLHPLKHFILPSSHGNPSKSVFHDLNDYRINKWRQRLNLSFTTEQTILPALYNYPDFHQFFPLHKNRWYSSSVFFIARKKASVS